MEAPYLLVIAATDPVATRVAELWGTPPATGEFVDGAPIRRLSESALLLHRPGPHIHDEGLDARLPTELQRAGTTLVFPSIHRSEQNVQSLTVHPLGNPGPTADVGGRPGHLDPADPRRMAAALRRLAEGAPALGLPVSYEATHHGPALELPACFVEIGYGAASGPPEAAVRLLADVLPDLRPDPSDRIALAVGGGHYAPHFTDLALRRHWAFGHLLSRHALTGLDPRAARAAWERSGSAEGIVYARAADAALPALQGLGPRLTDRSAPVRDASRPISGT